MEDVRHSCVYRAKSADKKFLYERYLREHPDCKVPMDKTIVYISDMTSERDEGIGITIDSVHRAVRADFAKAVTEGYRLAILQMGWASPEKFAEVAPDKREEPVQLCILDMKGSIGDKPQKPAKTKQTSGGKDL